MLAGFVAGEWGFYTAWLAFMSTTPIEVKRDLVKRRIHEAFKHVTREDGVSLHEAAVIDNFGSDEERKQARLLDLDMHWAQISSSEIAENGVALSFLDDVGFRYYIPAYMIWVLDNCATTRSSSYDSTVFSLDFANLHPERISIFNEEQRAAIYDFLYFMFDEHEDRDALEAISSFWHRYAKR